MKRSHQQKQAPGRWALAAGVVIATLAAVVVPSAAGGAAAATRAVAGADNPTNPIAKGPLGVYRGSADGIYPAYQSATGTRKRLLGKIALQPRVRWVGSWIPADQIRSQLSRDIAAEQGGDPDVVVPLAVFRLWPKGEGAKNEPLTTAQRQAYRAWIDQAAKGIGDSRVAMVLEPDLGVALKGWRPEVRLRLASYAARVFGALPQTAVYLDASDADWLPVDKAVTMLRHAGVANVRGFALGATHYASVRMQIGFGQQVVGALQEAGLGTKHFVIDTADNGRPFTFPQFFDKHPGGDFDNAPVCQTRSERRCVTLGIPSTTDVANPKWQLPADLAPVAARLVDAYLWFGRPWLYRQATPFRMQRALAIARTTPWS